MTKVKDKNIGFEVLNETEDHVVYKRVLSPNIPNKERKKREMELPKLVISYFDKSDLEHLQRLQSEIANKIVVKKEGEFVIVLKALKKFLTK